MSYFTDNPLEKLMNEKPEGQREKKTEKKKKNHPCSNCIYLKNNFCSVCYKDLLKN